MRHLLAAAALVLWGAIVGFAGGYTVDKPEPAEERPIPTLMWRCDHGTQVWTYGEAIAVFPGGSHC